MLRGAAFLLGFFLIGQTCPHEGSDHRLLGHWACPLQRKLTIENARPPRTIWSFRVFQVSIKIDPKHPHLLIEWPVFRGGRAPASGQAPLRKWWRFRVGYRWDANAKAYIFPSLALKKVEGPMREYQTGSEQRQPSNTPKQVPDLAIEPSAPGH